MRFDWYTAAISSSGQKIAIFNSDDPENSTLTLDTEQSEFCLRALDQLANDDTVAGNAWSQARQALLRAFWHTVKPACPEIRRQAM
jgi:hypothetical protein